MRLRLWERHRIKGSYFNPRTREGCDDRSATYFKLTEVISIHAPVKGATRTAGNIPGPYRDFNPRTREGCDGTALDVAYAPEGISIHAPVKGATAVQRRPICQQRDFNPRTREGCDISQVCTIFLPAHFNPRTREGCDLSQFILDAAGILISIHAPVKGATKYHG